MTRQFILQSLDIKATDFVVDVGGGHNPFARANVVFEKYPFEHAHRSFDMAHTAPVVIADGAHLPLPDEGCDLLFASHIVEHLPEPDRFLAEVRRCSRSVYLEFPSLRRELMFAWAFHEWLVEVEADQLVFYRNDVPQLFGDFFHRNYDPVFNAWAMQRHSELNQHLCCQSDRLAWRFAGQTAFEHALELSAKGTAKVHFGSAAVPASYTWWQVLSIVAHKALSVSMFERVRRRLRARGAVRVRPLTAAVVSRLACQRCRTCSLLLGADEVVCRYYDARYRKRNGLFDFDTESGSGCASRDFAAPEYRTAH